MNADALLPPRRILSDLRYVPLKSGLAVAFALLIDVPLGNPDHVSSGFVSIMCVAPTVLLGLRRASVQFSGSVIGGIFGAAAMWSAGELRLPLLYAIPPAVMGATLAMLALRRPEAVAVAAFTALFLPALPHGSALDTFLQRLLAISIGASSGLIVNASISFIGYRSIFSRRLRVARETVARATAVLRDHSKQRDVLRPAFEMLDAIQDELHAALNEPTWAHTPRTFEILAEIQSEVDGLRRIVHLLYDALILIEEGSLDTGAREPLLALIASREERSLGPASTETTPPELNGALLALYVRMQREMERSRR